MLILVMELNWQVDNGLTFVRREGCLNFGWVPLNEPNTNETLCMLLIKTTYVNYEQSIVYLLISRKWKSINKARV